MPYCRAVPRSEVQKLPAFAPTFCAVPDIVSCLGWLVLKITVPAEVVAVAMVFSPVLASCSIQPLAASRSAAACVWVCPEEQVDAVCRQLLVTSNRLLSVMAAGAVLAAVRLPVLRSLNM